MDLARQPRRKVAFGAAVTVSQPGGDRRTFTIVGEDEADLKQGKISYVSPLAEALLDARVGKTVLWRRPAGDIKLTVEEIDYPELTGDMTGALAHPRAALAVFEHDREVRGRGLLPEQQAGDALLGVPAVGPRRVLVAHHGERPRLLALLQPGGLDHELVVQAQPAALEVAGPALGPRRRRDAPALDGDDAREQPPREVRPAAGTSDSSCEKRRAWSQADERVSTQPEPCS